MEAELALAADGPCKFNAYLVAGESIWPVRDHGYERLAICSKPSV
jgi:hypothetical protein